MILPFSNYRYITPVMILLSLALVVALTMLGDYNVTMLWLNWIVSVILTTGIWHTVSRFRLEGGTDVRAFAIALPIINAALQFNYCFMPVVGSFANNQLLLLALLAIIALVLCEWQEEKCILVYLLVGIIIGGATKVVPQVLLWTLLIPLCCYFMRCWSMRNVLSGLTGILLGIWVVYCGLFAIEGENAADAMIANYDAILNIKDYLHYFTQFSLWQYLFLAFVLLLQLSYGFFGLFVNVGQTVRATSSGQLISSLCILFFFLVFVDPAHLSSYLCLQAFLTAMQITIRQTCMRSLANEWLIVFIIVLATAFCVLPSLIVLLR